SLKQSPRNTGSAKFGVSVFADSLLSIPKALLQNAGLDVQSTLSLFHDQHAHGKRLGVDLSSGRLIDPVIEGVLDNYCVVKHIITSSALIASNILLVDEIMKAGKSVGK